MTFQSALWFAGVSDNELDVKCHIIKFQSALWFAGVSDFYITQTRSTLPVSFQSALWFAGVSDLSLLPLLG